jgi:hypothetical protein
MARPSEWNEAMTQSQAPDPDNRVVDIRTNRKFHRAQAHVPAPAGEIEQFERNDDEPDDFRHRMVANTVAFGFVVLLIVAAIWLADSILTMRKKQDCGLQGRKNCVPIEAPVSTR